MQSHRAFLTVALLLATLGTAHAETDRTCVLRARMAASFAELKRTGFTEKQTIAVAQGARDENVRSYPKQKRIEDDTFQKNVKIIEYMYTVNLNAEDVRGMVYAKCKAGDFE